MTAFALIVAVSTLGVAIAATLGLRLLPTVRLQLAGFAFLAVALPLVAVLLSGWVMFHMGDDVKILGIAASSAAAAVGAALVLGSSIVQRIERLRRASAALAAGDLTVRAPDRGPRELAELGRSFNEMAGDLEELFNARRELVAAASHDLRTPIASINAMLEAIEDNLATPEEYLRDLRDQSQRLGALVEDLFDVARIDAGALAYELQVVSLGPIVTSCLRTIAAQARAKSVRLEQRGDNERARCAPLQVERVLLNVLTNALQHTPADGTVAVVLDREDDAVRITVEDSGSGLSAETARRMFDRFWRGDPSRNRTTGGGGLGLTIARGLVESQGGVMSASSNDAGGATVWFTLPRAA
jgi:signal transduction histidine kinase